MLNTKPIKRANPESASCYEWCFNVLHRHRRDSISYFGASANAVYLVQGYPRLSQDTEDAPAGTKYGHCWIEADCRIPCESLPGGFYILTFVFDPYAEEPIVKSIYYLAGRIDEATQYNYKEASRMVMKHKHYGPWENVPTDALFVGEKA